MRQHAEISDELVGRLKAFDVEDEGGEDGGGGDGADAGNAVEAIGLRQGAASGNQQVFQAFLPRPDVAKLADLLADQFFDGGAVERSDGSAGVFEQRRDVFIGQISDLREVCRRRGGQQRRGGIAVDEFENPLGREVFGEQGQFGEGQGEQVMELVDETGALADDGLEPAGDLAKGADLE